MTKYWIILFIIAFFDIFMLYTFLKYINIFISNILEGCGNKNKCYGFLRLRCPSKVIILVIRRMCLLRELHIYGNVKTTYHNENKQKCTT